MKTVLYRLPKIAKTLDGGNILYFILNYIKLLFFYVRVRFRKTSGVTFNFVFKGHAFKYCFTELCDIDVFFEIYVLRRYFLKLDEEPKVILDLGAHAGDTAIFYSCLYPNAMIYALEPSPKNYKRLLKNVKKNDTNIVPINSGIGNVSGHIPMYFTPSTLGFSLKERSTSTDMGMVDILTLHDLFSKYNLQKVDLIKFDVEGSEEVFKEINLDEYSSAYVGEVHGDLMDISSEDFFDLFSEWDTQITSLKSYDRFFVSAIKS